MRGNQRAHLDKGLRRTVGILVLGCLMTGQVSIGDSPEDRPQREQAALDAYWEALQACQLAREGNPRLRCYEAARDAYLQALEDCRNGNSSR